MRSPLVSFSLFLCTLFVETLAQTPCCFPDQFEAATGVLEGYYTRSLDSPGEAVGHDYVSYDYPNRRLVGNLSLLVNGENRMSVTSIVDFEKGKQYVIKDSNCTAYNLVGDLSPNCLPDNSTFVGSSFFGAGNNRLQFDSWNYNFGSSPISMTVTRETCIPIAETIMGIGQILPGTNGFVSVRYTGLTLGIRDVKVFQPPENCLHLNVTMEYFFAGYTRNEALAVLRWKHGISLSLRTLGRIRKRLGLGRCHREIELREAVRYELTGSGSYLGCRALARKLLSKYNIRASRQKVLALQRDLDPDGVESRKSHCISRRTYRNPGPNHCIHIDGYDKLKPFGFPIHAAVDGYSRRVLWLKVGYTNNNPSVVASHFMGYVKEIQGVPAIVRMDAGTENVDIQDIQVAFREEHNDAFSGEESVIIGSSHSNQRVERWWSSMRSGGIGFWIDLFKDMVENGLFSTADPAHIECARFCFMDVLNSELSEIKVHWNQHRIRACKQSGFMGGKPDLLYFTPELFGARDRKLVVNMHDIWAVGQVTSEWIQDNPNEDFHTICRDIVRNHGKTMPRDIQESKDLLLWLMNELKL